MNWKELPVNGWMNALMVLLLGAGLTNAWSQEEPNADSGSSAEAAAGTRTTESAQPPASPSAPAADPNDENSPFDYQASEEISQDLSVSFPVDI